MSEKKFGSFDGEMLIGTAKEKDLQKEAKEIAEKSITIEEGKIKQVCSTCGKEYGIIETEGEGKISHGFCLEHMPDEEKGLEEFKKKFEKK